jgi:hypothetical protein
MTTFSGGYSGKPSWRLDINVQETTLDAANNRSYVTWTLNIYRGNGDTPYNSDPSAYGLGGPGGFSGNMGGYRFGGSGSGADYSGTPAGSQVQVASGGAWVTHSPDGSGSVTFNAYHNSGSTLGNANVTDSVYPLTKLTQAPSSVTGVTATRISDSQVNLAWTNNFPTNGGPTNNDINVKINNGAFGGGVSIGGSSNGVFSTQPNQKREYQVRAYNSAGYTAFSATSNPVYTTPAAPTNPIATKQANLDITVSWTPNVGYSEHTHEVWHGTVSAGVTTWDSAALATLASGTSSYTHAAPSAGQVHVYRIRAVAAGLQSGYATTSSVQLLAAPNKPTIPALPAYTNKAAAFRFSWVHNAVDASAQTKYQVRYSTNGGSTWTTGAKTTSTNQYYDFAANTFTANQALTVQVRTKGSYDTGSDSDASYSPWSDLATTTFKTLPVVTITDPSNGEVLNDATLRVSLGFSQAESAGYVKFQVELLQGASSLELLESSIRNGITLATPLQNGTSYTIRARGQDSNGLWSAWVTSTVSVTYLSPVPAVVTTTFLVDSGYGQVDLAIAAPSGSQATATTVTITRQILGVEEVIVQDYPASANLTFLDTTPTIHGTNLYTVTTKSSLGAQSVVTSSLVTTECRRAYLNTGAGFATVGVFGGNMSVDESLSVASAVVQASGRAKPIGLYGVETSVKLKVSSLVFEGFGSTVSQLRAILLTPGKACYRDSSGRRVFGSVDGSISYTKTNRADLSFTLTETS